MHYTFMNAINFICLLCLDHLQSLFIGELLHDYVCKFFRRCDASFVVLILDIFGVEAFLRGPNFELDSRLDIALVVQESEFDDLAVLSVDVCNPTGTYLFLAE